MFFSEKSQVNKSANRGSFANFYDLTVAAARTSAGGHSPSCGRTEFKGVRGNKLYKQNLILGVPHSTQISQITRFCGVLVSGVKNAVDTKERDGVVQV